ncbi:hypothetical protein GO495_08935 [Chitinophaga oryziterrae]|uniref:Right-handed parallel beta-helix repeat-containing protein n=1 Tax=Chitinophaga oryziterrae TaxID=1031224 RepID=A0A6N8J7W7_9BACT|nr:hypothetical protein [Chitinophaga oryziterrae]MVT40701.1 hypothetical protein [Chitinophaga oryziterrae]
MKRWPLFVSLLLLCACEKEDVMVTPPCGDSIIAGSITTDLFLDSCKAYKLSGLVSVTNNATLTISKGALIQGIKGLPVSQLVITKGAKLLASGTSFSPIIFSSDQAPGDWGGIVLSGTGILQYARIEYGRLSLENVDSAATLDHIEVYKSGDDAFRFSGGKVNASYLIAVEPVGKMFGLEKGYVGHITYGLGLSLSNGVESDRAGAVIDHMTMIGSGHGAYLRNSMAQIINSIFMGFNEGILLDDSTGNCYRKNSFMLDNNLVHACHSPYNERAELLNNIYSGADPNADILLVNPFSKPATASAANWYPREVSVARFFAAGAFIFGEDDWTANWSRF